MNRRTPGVLVAAIALLGGWSWPSTSMAAPPETATEYNASLECTGTTSGGEPVLVITGTSAQFGDQLVATVGDPEEPRLTAYSVSGGWAGSEISFDLEVYAGGEGGGHLEPPLLGSFTATTTETSTTEHTDRGGSGNQHVRATIVTATLTAEAVLSLPGVTVDSLNCSGSSSTATYVSNSPASTVRFERRFYDSARCQGNAQVGLFGPEDGEYYLSVEVGEANNQYNLFGVVEEPKGKSFTAVLPLRNSQTGEVLGEYEVAVTLTPKGEGDDHGASHRHRPDHPADYVVRRERAGVLAIDRRRCVLRGPRSYDPRDRPGRPGTQADLNTTAQRRSGRCAADHGR